MEGSLSEKLILDQEVIDLGKLSNLISMLQLLRSGRKYSINELAEKLEVTPRMVRVYKDELEKAGVYIDSIQGVYGGYVLNQKLTSMDIGLSIEDVNLLKLINDYMSDKKDFVFKREFYNLMLKVLGAYENVEKSKITNVPHINKFIEEKDTEDEMQKYNRINYAIKNKKKIKIKYISINSNIVDRIIHPCGLFVYDNYWYVSAYCELKKQTRSFILSRILNYEVLNENF